MKPAREKLAALDKKLAAGQAAWEETALTYQPKWEVLTPQNLKADNGVTLKALPDGSVLAGGAMPPSSMFEVTAESRLKNITAFRMELIPDDSLPEGGSGRGAGGKGVVTLFEVRTGDKQSGPLARDSGFQIGRVGTESRDSPVGAVEARLGRQSGDEQAALRRDRNVAHVQARQATMTFRIGNEYEGAPVGRFRISVTDSEYPEVVPEEMAAILRTPAAERSEKDAAALTKYYVSHPVERRRASEVWPRSKPQRRAAENKIPSTMVMSEMATPRDTFIMLRGAYDKPGDKVTPAVPAFLPPMPADAPRNRLGLARWLVDPANPLTARVAVNRYWQMYFGTGLVKTAEDFGSRGKRRAIPNCSTGWLRNSSAPGGM